MSDLVHHEPLHRAPEVVAFEIVVTLGQAYLAGVCLVLAVQTGQPGLVAVVLGLLAVGAAAGYGLWLFGGPGTLMTLVNVPLLVLCLFALLVSLQPDATGIGGTIVRSDALGLALQLVAIASAVLGIVGGVFLPGPRRRRWHHAHGLDATARPSVTTASDALAALGERLRASFRRLRSAAEARRLGRTRSSETAATDKIPTHADIHGHEPTYRLREDDDWDPQERSDAGDADDNTDADDSARYRPPRR